MSEAPETSPLQPEPPSGNGAPTEVDETQPVVRLFSDYDLPADGSWHAVVERISPTEFIFPGMARPISVGGWQTDIEGDEDQLTKEKIEERFGGGKFCVKLYVDAAKTKKNKAGMVTSVRFRLKGDPAPLSPERVQRDMDRGVRTPYGGQIRDVTGAEANIAREGMKDYAAMARDAQKREHGLQEQLRKEVGEKAALKGEMEGLKQRVAAMETAEPVKAQMAKDSNEHERGMYQIMQAQHEQSMAAMHTSHEAQIQSLREQIAAKQNTETSIAEAATAPMRQFMVDMSGRHQTDLAAAETRAQSMLGILKEQNAHSLEMVKAQNTASKELQDQRMADLREEIRTMRAVEKRSMIDQLGDITKIVKAVKDLGGVGGDDEKPETWEKLLEAGGEYAPHLPGIIQAVGVAAGALLRGQLPMMPPGALPPGAAQPPPEPSVEEVEEAEVQAQQVAEERELVLMLEAVLQGMRTQKPAKTIASYLLTKHEALASRIATAQLEQILALASTQKPELGSVGGQEYVRAVFSSLQEQIH